MWAATGIWHGASWNFVLWGLYFWVLLLVEKFVLLRWLKRAPGAVGHLYTLFFVLVSWTIFAIEDFGQLGEYLKVMFGLGGVPLIDGAFKYYAANYLPVLCISALAATPLGAAVYRRLNVRTAHILGAVSYTHLDVYKRQPMLQSAYSQIETGRRNLFVSDLIALRTVLNAQYDDFFRGLVPIDRYKDETQT